MARCLLKEHRYEEAEAAALGILAENPYDPNALSQLLSIFFKSGRMSAAEELFLAIKKDGLAEERCYATMVNGYCYGARLEDARRIFDESAREGKASVFAIRALFKTHPYDQSASHAMELLGVARGLRLANVIIYTTVIGVLGRNGDIPGAKSVFEEAYGCGCIDPMLVTSMLRLLVNDRQTDEAWRVFSQAIAKGIVDNMLCKCMMHLHLDAQDTVRAREVFDIAVASSCCDIDLCDMMLRAYSHEGRTEDARAIFDIADGLGIVDDDLRSILIDVYCKSGMLQEAQGLFDELKGTAHDSHKPYESLICAYADSGDLERARSMFEEARSKGLLTTRSCGRITTAYYNAEEFAGLECLLGSIPDPLIDASDASVLRAEILRKKKSYAEARSLALSLAAGSSVPEETRHRARIVAAFARKDGGDPRGAFTEFMELFWVMPVDSHHFARLLCGIVFSWQGLHCRGILDRDSLGAIHSALKAFDTDNNKKISRDIRNAILALESYDR